MFSIARNPLHANVNIRTIQISQCPCFLKANYCLKIHNADFKLALLISGYVVYLILSMGVGSRYTELHTIFLLFFHNLNLSVISLNISEENILRSTYLSVPYKPEQPSHVCSSQLPMCILEK